jgi:hypothetical protein
VLVNTTDGVKLLIETTSLCEIRTVDNTSLLCVCVVSSSDKSNPDDNTLCDDDVRVEKSKDDVTSLSGELDDTNTLGDVISDA